MDYKQHIVRVLLQAGMRGLPVWKIAHHVHHEVNSLFEPIPYEEVYAEVRRVVLNNSKGKTSIFRHAKHYGHYRLNRGSAKLTPFLKED